MRPLLRLRQRALAEAIGEEWRGVQGEMRPADVPLTGLAGTAVALDRGQAVEAIAAYGASDLLCYRAERPEALVVRQALAWQEWLDWAAERWGAQLVVTAGVMPVRQDERALGALREAVAGFDAFGLAGLGVIVPALGSLVLGLAVAEGRLEAAEAYRISILDELFEEEAWGVDGEKMARRGLVGQDVEDAARFMGLARGG